MRKVYDERYRCKLNMLEPGLVMVKIIAGLAALGAVFAVLGCRLPEYIAFGAAGAVGFVLFVLLCVEARQDKRLNELAGREKDKERK